jgi:hypothetical protein
MLIYLSPGLAAMKLHESFESHEDFPAATDRNFGFVFTIIFALAALFPLLTGRPIRVWCAVLSAAILTLTLIHSGLLAPLNRAWGKLSVLISTVTNAIILGLLFVGFSVIHLLMRLRGRDLLRLRRDPSAPTYWLVRSPAGPAPATMTEQY